MSRETAWERGHRRARIRSEGRESDEVADNRSVRLKLLERVRAGEISLEEAQRELRRIKRDAKKNGKVTLSQYVNERM